MRMHGILVALPSGIMFGLFWAVKQFHVYCLIFSKKLAAGRKPLKKAKKQQFSEAGGDWLVVNLPDFTKI
jgi:hypothetical protein